MSQEHVTDLFMKNAARSSAETVRVRSDAELNEAVAGILDGVNAVYCPGNTAKEKALSIPSDKLTEDYVNASVCLEEVNGAIAETGSLVCSSQGGHMVQAGLLAPHHVAIVSSENVYKNLDNFFESLGGGLPTNITLETGPSRTADIELTLTIGVHGPGRLTVILY
jgi:L-lactate dehydrogenase complex protein LldG